MKRQQSTQPFVAKKDIHKFMEELEQANDSVGSRYGDAYDDLREKLGMPTQNDSRTGMRIPDVVEKISEQRSRKDDDTSCTGGGR